MPIPVLGYQTPGSQSSRSSFTVLERVLYSALGVVLPVVCFVIAFRGYPPEPDWQKGGWDRYLLFVPDGRVGFPFYPLLIYSMSALCLLVYRPGLSRLLAVRLGLYAGIVMSLQYTYIQALAFEPQIVLALLVGLATNFILLGFLKLLERIPRIPIVLIAVTVALVSVAVIVATRFTLAGIVILIFAPAWCAGVYVKATLVARRLHREAGATPAGPAALIASWLAWLSAYAAAWKWSIINAVAYYATLPPTHSGCYIATAAAAGHPGFVGSTAVRAADGSVFRVNAQLRRLKCVEIALAAAWPAGHRRIRRAYDFAGPPLARIIALHPLLADLAFAGLKPFEWIAFGLLATAAPEVRRAACTLYSPTRP